MFAFFPRIACRLLSSLPHFVDDKISDLALDLTRMHEGKAAMQRDVAGITGIGGAGGGGGGAFGSPGPERDFIVGPLIVDQWTWVTDEGFGEWGVAFVLGTW